LDAAAIASAARVSPADYLAGILASSGSSKSQKMRACELLLRRAATADAVPVSPTEVAVNVYSVPRGAQVNRDGKIQWPDGAITDPPVLEPFQATPSLPVQRDERVEPEPSLEPLAVTEMEQPPNVMRLDEFLLRRRDDDGPAGAA
jgi:hypothetical protein